jgi:hypothetical protein
MGWDGIQNDGKRRDARAHIERGVGSDAARRTLAAKRIGDVIYAAIEGQNGNGPADVFGAVILLERARGWTYYKVMDEGMGPFESECPAEILDLLTETTDNYSLAWRYRCRANLLDQTRALEAT